MKASEFVAKLKDAAANHKTLYVMGCFGAPMNATNKRRYTQNHSYNKKAERTKMINAASDDTFGFDCVCLIKGILWGWTGDKSRIYGGASYATNNVPDIGADTMITVCKEVSTSGWDHIVPGEAVWLSGHIGVYIGDGLAVECTPKWANGVQVTAVGNIGAKPGYNTRTWTKHGKLPYIDYDARGSVAHPAVPISEKAIWDKLMAAIGNAYGVAGLMANYKAESAMRANNLQNTYESKLGYSDAAYTAAVDDGSYRNFVNDSAGYGLCQWTYWSRKKALLDYAKSVKKSIGDAGMQVDFTIKELKESYPGVWKVLREARSVREASDIVLTQYERPANMGDSVKAARASYAAEFYNTYAKSGADTAAPPKGDVKVDYADYFSPGIAGAYRVTAKSGLHIRAGAGTSKASLDVLKCGSCVMNYGFYSKDAGGATWLYVRTPNNIVGFCCGGYLKKQ